MDWWRVGSLRSSRAGRRLSRSASSPAQFHKPHPERSRARRCGDARPQRRVGSVSMCSTRREPERPASSPMMSAHRSSSRCSRRRDFARAPPGGRLPRPLADELRSLREPLRGLHPHVCVTLPACATPLQASDFVQTTRICGHKVCPSSTCSSFLRSRCSSRAPDPPPPAPRQNSSCGRSSARSDSSLSVEGLGHAAERVGPRAARDLTLADHSSHFDQIVVLLAVFNGNLVLFPSIREPLVPLGSGFVFMRVFVHQTRLVAELYFCLLNADVFLDDVCTKKHYQSLLLLPSSQRSVGRLAGGRVLPAFRRPRSTLPIDALSFHSAAPVRGAQRTRQLRSAASLRPPRGGPQLLRSRHRTPARFVPARPPAAGAGGEFGSRSRAHMAPAAHQLLPSRLLLRADYSVCKFQQVISNPIKCKSRSIRATSIRSTHVARMNNTVRTSKYEYCRL